MGKTGTFLKRLWSVGSHISQIQWLLLIFVPSWVVSAMIAGAATWYSQQPLWWLLVLGAVIFALLGTFFFVFQIWRILHNRKAAGPLAEPFSPSQRQQAVCDAPINQGTSLVYSGGGRQREIRLSVPKLTRRECEALIDDLTKLRAAVRAVQSEAQRSSFGYDVRMRTPDSYQQAIDAASATIARLENGKIEISTVINGSASRDMVLSLAIGTNRTIDQLLNSAKRIRDTLVALARDKAQMSTTVTAVMPLRDENHYDFQDCYDQVIAMDKLVEQLRKNL